MSPSKRIKYRFIFNALAGVSLLGFASTATAQEMVWRTKSSSDKGVYQPPTLLDTAKRISVAGTQTADSQADSIPSAQAPFDANRVKENRAAKSKQRAKAGGLVPTVVQATYMSIPQDEVDEVAPEVPAEPGSVLEPQPVPMIENGHGEVIYENSYLGPTQMPYHGEVACDAIPMDYGCDSPGDWLLGPRIFGNCCEVPNCGGCGTCSTGFIPLPNFHNGCWYSTFDWLNWERRGQDLPVLAQNTGVNPPVDLFGGQRLGQDMDNGFRVMLGRWSDPHRVQAVQARFWALEEQDFGFTANNTSTFAIGIPYLDANLLNADTIFPVIDPANAGESLNIAYDSNVLGADITIRHLWNRGLGGRIDVVYGYQYFRLDETLDIALATRRDDAINRLLTINDRFDIANNFHGAKLGFNVRYDENAWAFDGMFTLALGGIERKAALTGVGNIQNLDNPLEPPAPQPGGLFVQPSNAGNNSSSTFAVSPEVNVGLAYRLNHHMHFRVGYSYLMVTDVLQVHRTIDRSISLDQANPAPSRNFNYGDYWVQGLNLGLTFNY